MPSSSSGTGITPVDTFIAHVQTNILNPIITLMALGAFVVFIWGVVDYVRNADNDEKRKTGQQHILWGIVGMAILFGAVAVVNILRAILNIFSA